MTEPVGIEGECSDRFAGVRDAFANNFRLHGEIGAGVAVYHHGQPVVELWGGFADAARIRPWARDSIVNVYSTTKAITAICAHRLIEEGRLDIDAPVATYWPEFAVAGKDRITVRQVLSHKAGMAAFQREITVEELYDWDTVITALADQATWWEPGAGQHGYHPIIFGWLVGEIIRRVTGQSVRQYLHDTLTGPLALDFHIGFENLDAGPVDADRIADVVPEVAPADRPTVFALRPSDLNSVAVRAFVNPPRGPGTVNSLGWRTAEMPAVNGHTGAPALARLYGALANGGNIDGVHVLNPETISAAIVEQSSGPDRVLQVESRFSLGFQLPSIIMPVQKPRAFGHPGAGGSLGFADLDAGIGFGYVMNSLQDHLHGDPRLLGLIDAVYAAL